jgi:serine/threonine protein phosphatase PrpC
MEHLIMMSNKTKRNHGYRTRLIKGLPNPFLSWNKNNDNVCVPLKVKDLNSKKNPSSKKLRLAPFPKVEDQKVSQKRHSSSYKLLAPNNSKKVNDQNKLNNVLPKINLSNSSFLDNNNNESKRKSFSFFKNNIKKQNSLEKKVIKKYCALSEAGKDSYGMTKINQDSTLVLTNINNLINFNVFAVLDGHGPQGHLVSQYLVKYFTDFFNNNKEIKKCKDESDVFNLFLRSNYKLLKDTIINSEEKLKEEKDIEIEYSGSTCCMVIQMNQKIICANVGDSRAILLSEIIREDIISLSIDHKPESKNELERIKKYGGVVEKCLYEEGVRDGPYRVWNSSKQEYPGLAVSRSIGDLEASKLGVIPDPDFILKTLKNNMKFIVIASDGIWEFFSNKNVCDIVNNYYAKGDAEGATKELIEKGKKKWAEEGDNADDISVITIFF